MDAARVLLLVEDEDAVRLLLEDILKGGGFEVLFAGNGTDAISLLDAQFGTIHGLITDVNLGSGPDGWEIARHARQLNPDLPIVYMTGASGAEWAAEGVPHSTLVTKPFAPAQILTAITSLLNTSDSS